MNVGGVGEVRLDIMRPEDWPRVSAIYMEGIATDHASFETGVPPWEQWNLEHMGNCRLVARQGSEVGGWAALTSVSDRCVYAGVAEVSVYVGEVFRGRGIGVQLLRALVRASELEEIWTLQAGIFPENEASICMHERCGFRLVGRRERLGKMNGRWRDVLLLERRSRVIGSDNGECITSG